MSGNSAHVQDVTEATFQIDVIEKSKQVPVVVDFWAPWCGPCLALAPVLERLIDARGGEVTLAKINTDVEQNLAMMYGIEALPTVVAFRNGKPTFSFQSALPEAQTNRIAAAGRAVRSMAGVCRECVIWARVAFAFNLNSSACA